MISLRYIDSDLTPPDVAKVFDDLSYDALPVTGRIGGETLRYRRYSHRTGKTKQRTLTISADEFDKPFLEAWWGAERRFVYEGDYADDEIADGDWIEVITEGGVMPVELVEDLLLFKEFKVTMIDA